MAFPTNGDEPTSRVTTRKPCDRHGYGPGPVETACSRSLDLDVVSVAKIASMLEKAVEREQPVLPAAAGSSAGAPTGRFARDPAQYALPGLTHLTLIRGGTHDPLSPATTELETTP